MASKAYYRSVSLFWTLAVPAVLFAVIWYAYQSPGWVGGRIQRIIGPVLDPIIRWADRVI